MKTNNGNTDDAWEPRAAVEARKWMMRFQDSGINPETDAEFIKWRDTHPANKKEFGLISGIWTHTDFLKEHPVAEKILESNRSRPIPVPKKRWVDFLKVGSYGFQPLAAAAVLLLMVTGIWFVQSGALDKKTYRTATGNLMGLTLADGSTVNLDAETELTVRMTETDRQIDLETGRAFFSVAHDPARPFVVTAGQVSVRALGTAFKVSKEKTEEIIVSVVSGRVQVDGHPEPATTGKSKAPESTEKTNTAETNAARKNTLFAARNPSSGQIPATVARVAPTVLSAGQEITINKKKATYSVRPIDVKRVDTWRKGRLYFKDTALHEVIDEINRYLDPKLVIGDKQLNDMRVSMNFNIKDREHFVRTLEKTWPVSARPSSGGKIMLVKQD
ncbi:MAG: FecR domain-containing protein [Deltaproteobacteria bacterium]|nr:FecR domain-containing protein [Deltaproteobacteria bacterium]